MGVLLFAHSRWANQEEILDELKTLLAPLVCTDIDVRVLDRPYKTYYEHDTNIVITNGSQQQQSIHTQWPAYLSFLSIFVLYKIINHSLNQNHICMQREQMAIDARVL